MTHQFYHCPLARCIYSTLHHLFILQCILYVAPVVQCKMYIVRTMFVKHCTLHHCSCKIFIVHLILYIVYCILYIVHCAASRVSAFSFPPISISGHDSSLAPLGTDVLYIQLGTYKIGNEFSCESAFNSYPISSYLMTHHCC